MVESSDDEDDIVYPVEEDSDDEDAGPSEGELHQMSLMKEMQERLSRKRSKKRLAVELCSNDVCGCVGETCCEERWVCPVETDDK
eukprot:6144123-Karenia_brevis.AAC.1